MKELLLEIWASIKRNKLRTFLTGFSIAWGIFMLIILLGSGNGLQNGVMSNFASMNFNTISVGGHQTQLPYKGFQKWRWIRLTFDDMTALQDEFKENIESISAVLYKSSMPMSYGSEYVTANLQGITPGYDVLEGSTIEQGRSINAADMKEKRKVAVIDESTLKTMFKGEDPIGKMIIIDKIGYTVVGTYRSPRNWGSGYIYVPASTIATVYYGNEPYINDMQIIAKGIETREASEQMCDRIRKFLAARHTFSPEDPGGVWIWSAIENYLEVMMVFNGIKLFIWIIGLGTLMAGIVGVSNIMLVTVRERTNEFGVRKALGARPSSLVKLVLLESLIITAIFGYIGMIGGVGIMEVVNFYLERSAENAAATGDKFVTFLNPTLNLSITLSATITLIVAGMIAGYIPARRAARLKTIDAMRHNK